MFSVPLFSEFSSVVVIVHIVLAFRLISVFISDYPLVTILFSGHFDSVFSRNSGLFYQMFALASSDTDFPLVK